MRRDFLFLIVLVTNSVGAATSRAQLLSKDIEKELPSIIELYKSIHSAPELSHFEERTAALAAKELKAVGCTVLTGLGKFNRPEWKGHGVAGVLKNGNGPVVLIRA